MPEMKKLRSLSASSVPVASSFPVNSFTLSLIELKFNNNTKYTTYKSTKGNATNPRMQYTKVSLYICFIFIYLSLFFTIESLTLFLTIFLHKKCSEVCPHCICLFLSFPLFYTCHHIFHLIIHINIPKFWLNYTFPFFS